MAQQAPACGRCSSSCCLPVVKQLRQLLVQRHLIQDSRAAAHSDSLRALVAAEAVDVEFAKLKVKELTHRQGYEVVIEASESSVTDAGLTALLEFMGRVFPLMSSGFMLTYIADVFNPQFDVLSGIHYWSCQPSRNEQWQERCICWKIVTPEGPFGMYYQLAFATLYSWFCVYEPGNPVYLVTDVNKALDDNDMVVSSSHEDRADSAFDMGALTDRRHVEKMVDEEDEDDIFLWLYSFVADDSSEHGEVTSPKGGAHAPSWYDTFFGEGEAGVEEVQVAPKVLIHSPSWYETLFGEDSKDDEEVERHDSREKGSLIAVKPVKVHKGDPLSYDSTSLPVAVDLGCAVASHWYSEKAGISEILIQGRDAPLDDEMLDHLFAYVDAFVASDMSKNGFGITYDFRALRLPSMNMIMRVGEWGSLPERKTVWEVKNLTSSVVVSSGMAFAMSKAALVGFFYICPPIVRTYLLFDPSEDRETACFFDPLPKETCPATDAVRPEDETKDARKPDVKTLKEHTLSLQPKLGRRNS
uniref:Uncharacterized protein n=1 Tax=Noctiluca scintillans TaxID=2966 RepID=A0A7S0ZY34_NOCSC|mmetsp:Transcript_23638/g.62279  ORF Transcript_23638/g.62279 Transcript_23638/m.62279 type:complete len:527 (+) Transcript_23638:248-1828(+)|eukprot:CAMPEP_0194515794 /NCGR_PEP_ID=MMETSP0253-20130528/48552_1 /TAXON_ID=2966 /ORGANISM="Noctiluca scintillans" /LENGTH=526 /DNA_ID=CAMNT_0039359575 /DNA_START=166 /DNA_END=1746 /DNA_ORIENTATION=-